MEDTKILCLGSGSSGNCYLIGYGDEYIMVECGLPFKTIVSRLTDQNVELEQVKAVVVSHSHKDHSLALEDFKALGIPVFAPFVAPNSEGIDKGLTLTSWAKVRAF